MALQVHYSSNRVGHCITSREGGQLTSPTMHAQRCHRSWSRDLASPTAHLNSCTGCSCHCAGMHVLSSAIDSVNMISAISPSSKSTRRCQMLTSLSIFPLRSTCFRLVLCQAQLLGTSLQSMRRFLDLICPCCLPPETQPWHVLRRHRSVIPEQWIPSKTHVGFAQRRQCCGPQRDGSLRDPGI